MDNFVKDFLWKVFNQEEEETRREQFNTFLDEMENGLIRGLDESYKQGNMEIYTERLNIIKEKGIKVFRDDKGKHRLEFM